jgi:hypothetical protein
MRSLFVFITSRIKQMPFGIRLFSGLCVFAPIFALSLYARGDSQISIGLSKVLLMAIGSAIFIFGFLLATWWSRPLLMLYLAISLIWAIFQHYTTYSSTDYLGLLATDGFIVWVLYFRRDVRDYYAGAPKSAAVQVAEPTPAKDSSSSINCENNMSQLRKIHAVALNFLARVFGVMAIIAGVVFTIWGLSLVLDHNATIDVNGVPSNDPWEKAIVLIVGLVAVVLGILMLMARPYRPRQ